MDLCQFLYTTNKIEIQAFLFFSYLNRTAVIYDFTYEAYTDLINMILRNGYVISNYHEYISFEKVCILRHDIDLDIEKAFKIAELESSMGVYATYFILINTNFYNAFEGENVKTIKKIISLGHSVGLHFDETQYMWNKDINLLAGFIQKEITLLEKILEIPINIVSMHCPSKYLLDSNLNIPNIVNSYSHVFFKQFKYLSDSLHRWREDVEDIVCRSKFEKLHLLTHPFWYREQKQSMRDKIYQYIIAGNLMRYNELEKAVVPNLDDIIEKGEIAL
jgi:hypothetical protein